MAILSEIPSVEMKKGLECMNSQHGRNQLRKQLMVFLVFLFRQISHYVFMLLYAGRKRVVPAVKDPLLLKSATTLAAEIREGKISSEMLVRAYINRICEVEPYLNALVDTRFTEAIEEAKEADALISSKSRSPELLEKEKPLLGVPFTVKVLLGVKGLRCTGGCLLFKDLKAHEDAVAVSLMKKAGAICVGNTNAPEFGLNFETYNKLHGTTNNPYDTSRTCGGSSGGEAAILAAAGSVIGIGNDMGGSCRFPAFNCCIFGHKPTSGIISNAGSFPVLPAHVNSIVSAGPMCRYAEDLTTIMKILTGELSHELKIDKTVNFKSVKFYYMLGNCGSLLSPKLDPELEESVEKVVQYFKDEHAAVPSFIHLKGMDYAFELWVRTLISFSSIDTFKQLTGGKATIEPRTELLNFLLGRSNFGIGSVFTFNNDLFDYLTGKNRSEKFHEILNGLDKELQKILDEEAVLFLPTFPKTATYHTETTLMIYSVGYMGIFNVLGYPVTQCTLGLGRSGLPIGLQVVAGKNRDYLTLSVAREIEKAFGGWVPPGQ